jgi:hypothetical protein
VSEYLRVWYELMPGRAILDLVVAAVALLLGVLAWRVLFRSGPG